MSRLVPNNRVPLNGGSSNRPSPSPVLGVGFDGMWGVRRVSSVTKHDRDNKDFQHHRCFPRHLHSQLYLLHSVKLYSRFSLKASAPRRESDSPTTCLHNHQSTSPCRRYEDRRLEVQAQPRPDHLQPNERHAQTVPSHQMLAVLDVQLE